MPGDYRGCPRLWGSGGEHGDHPLGHVPVRGERGRRAAEHEAEPPVTGGEHAGAVAVFLAVLPFRTSPRSRWPFCNPMLSHHAHGVRRHGEELLLEIMLLTPSGPAIR